MITGEVRSAMSTPVWLKVGAFLASIGLIALWVGRGGRLVGSIVIPPEAVVAFLGVLLLLVVVHEAGHFVTAKMAGVTVKEFGLGYPPRLASFTFRGTLYSLNLLPLGGFVKLLGEEDPSERGSFASRSIPWRLIILGAGPFMNLVLPVALIAISLMIPHRSFEGPVYVGQVAAGSPAEAAGLRPGDVILTVAGRPVHLPQDVRYQSMLHLGSEMELTVRRGGDTKMVGLTPRWTPPEGEGPVGITPTMLRGEAREVVVSTPLPEALVEGARRTADMFTLFKNGIQAAMMGQAEAALSGPIGIAQATGEVAMRGGLPPLLEWAAFLSLNLAIMNILPIPMLDGGRMAFVLLEWVRRGRRIRPDREGLAHLVGFACLLALVAAVSVVDIQRLLEGGSVIR